MEVPTPTIVTVLPETVATAVLLEVKVTGNWELAVADKAKLASPKVLMGKAANVTDWLAFRNVNNWLLVAFCPPTVMLIGPVVAPDGTVTVSWVAEAIVTTATVPLNDRILLAGLISKLVPVTITEVPIEPDAGVKEVIVGKGGVAKFCSIEIELLPELAVAMSGKLSPFKSPKATDLGL